MPPLALSNHSNVCTTPACYALSESMLKVVNLTVDPCSDFFEYTCGNWVKAEPVRSPDIKSYNIMLKTQEKSLQDIISFLDGTFEELLSVIQTGDSTYHTKDQIETDKRNFYLTQNYYQSCLDTKSRSQMGATPLFPILAEIQNSFFPLNQPLQPKYVAMAIATSKLYGVQTIIDADTEIPYDLDHSKNQIYMGYMNYNTMITIKNFKSYLHYQANLETMLQQVVGQNYFDDSSYNHLVNSQSLASNFTLWSDTVISEAVVNFIDLESRLINITDVLAETEYDPTGNNLQGLKDSSKMIDWDTFLAFIVSENYASSNSLAKYNDKHFKILDELLLSTPVKVLQEYWIIRTVQMMFDSLHFPGDELVVNTRAKKKVPNFVAPSSKEAANVSPKDICGQETSVRFKNIIGRFFTLSSFGASNEKKQAEDFVKFLQLTWLDHLPNTEWVDDVTRTKIIEKVKALHPKVAYSTNVFPDWRNPSDLEKFYHGVTTDEGYTKGLNSITYLINARKWEHLDKKLEKDEWDDSNFPHQWNALYNPNDNSIEIPIGAFQKPFYSSEQPQYLNYGGLGAMIGHELVHSLDSSGRFYNASGYNDDWFSESSSEKYNKKSQCFIDQFNRFSLTGPDNIQLPLNGTNVLGENIADSGGLTIALNGYRKYLTSIGKTEQTLPGFENHTPEQLFYISHGFFTCSTVSRDGAQEAIDDDPHAPLYFRNIGVFQNSVEFAKAFNCPVNSRMNPETKCSIW